MTFLKTTAPRAPPHNLNQEAELDQLIAAGLRSNLRYFIQKVFQTVSPGEPYLHNWHIDAIVHALMRVHTGDNRRLLINQPPRSLKSICTSVAYVAWRLGHDPSSRIFVASYSAELAADLHRQFRLVVESDWYRELFPNTQWTKSTNSDFVTNKNGGRYAVSVGGTITGLGANLIIIDDPLNANEAFSATARRKVIAWYTGSLVSRLNNQGTGAIVVVAQRLHEDDLPGYLLRARGFERLCLPAIAIERQVIALPGGKVFVREPGDVLHPERESLEILERIRAEMGSLAFSAAYQQTPLPLEGNLCRREWFQFYERLPELSPGDKIVQSWDIATSLSVANDWSVCTTWMIHGNDYYLISVFRARLEYPAPRRKVIELAGQNYANTVLIEDIGPGANLLQDLHNETPVGMTRPIGVKPEGSKQDRFGAQTAKIEAGHVHLPNEADWLADFLDELLGFPASRHDDQVDSVSQFLSWAHRDSQWSKAIWASPTVVYLKRSTMFDHPGAGAEYSSFRPGGSPLTSL